MRTTRPLGVSVAVALATVLGIYWAIVWGRFLLFSIPDGNVGGSIFPMVWFALAVVLVCAAIGIWRQRRYATWAVIGICGLMVAPPIFNPSPDYRLGGALSIAVIVLVTMNRRHLH